MVKFIDIRDLATPPVVGERYLVPAVRINYADSPRGWYPLNGPLHDDAEYLGFDESHWHVDGRFLTEAGLTR